MRGRDLKIKKVKKRNFKIFLFTSYEQQKWVSRVLEFRVQKVVLKFSKRLHFCEKKIILALNFFVHEQSQLNAEVSNDARLLWVSAVLKQIRWQSEGNLVKNSWILYSYCFKLIIKLITSHHGAFCRYRYLPLPT